MKIPKPRKLPSGRWYVQLMVNGERVNRTFNTEQEALLYATEIVTGAKGLDVSSSDFSVGKAAEKYINANKGVLSPSTIAGYQRITRNALQPISRIPLRTLKQTEVDRWVKSLAREGKSPKTIRNAHGFLSAVLKEFRPQFTLTTKLPKFQREEITIPSMEELRLILRQAKGTRYELPIALAIWLGLRASEIRGLTWDSVKGNTLTITQAMVEGDEGPVVKGTKTFAGRRTLPLNDYLLGLIEAQPKDGEYIVNITGGAIYKGFSRICENAGVPHFRFHDLRHVNASVMIGENVPSKYITARMGHATTDMVNRVYGHTMEHKMRVFDKVVNDALVVLLDEEDAQ